jgi:hypothetical protein
MANSYELVQDTENHLWYSEKVSSEEDPAYGEL